LLLKDAWCLLEISTANKNIIKIYNMCMSEIVKATSIF